ncbi:unnamed protein product [Acanthosepion pharaonis]|uniref:Uncharacterized protein n=1 Tax=Acanthosepion pharaonis TaxID=158019 RepID=A0A812DH32_ACAPH|nr:unnamed protein product [Sepia pharaonis]
MTLRALADSKPHLARRSTQRPSVPLTSTVDGTTSVIPYTPQLFLRLGRRIVEMRPGTKFTGMRSSQPLKTRDLKAARSKAQQTARRCANDYWVNLCSRIQTAADSGNARGMYTSIKTATGSTPINTAPLRSKVGEVITDQGKQLEYWVKYYLELYTTRNVVRDAALDALPSLPVMKESDSPPSEVLKSGKPVLLRHLHELLCLCWEKDHVPRDMRDANIVTLYKNKGDRSDCNNYRGISRLSFVGKVFAHVVLPRLQNLVCILRF